MSGTRPERVLDPVCGMTVDVAMAEEAGLIIEHDGRTYAFCRSGCLRAFQEEPAVYAAKAEQAHAITVPQSVGLPVIDEGMRRWYESCSCCLSDAYPTSSGPRRRAGRQDRSAGWRRYLRSRRSPGGCRTMTEQRAIPPTEDPVCGMTVDPAQARERGLTLTHEGTEYALCGKGCLLEFRDDPAQYLDAAYTPSM